jgi:hypothetical protein
MKMDLLQLYCFIIARRQIFKCVFHWYRFDRHVASSLFREVYIFGYACNEIAKKLITMSM